jgi:NADPH:quinone reductase-like Zn-dependent oxidoreductase
MEVSLSFLLRLTVTEQLKGSTATGALAIQYAKLSGLSPIIATCSAHNNDYVKSLGADATFDYKSPTCAADIKKYNNNIAHAFDCISEGDSTAIAVGAMRDSGGVYSALLTVAKEKVTDVNPKVESKMTLGIHFYQLLKPGN